MKRHLKLLLSFSLAIILARSAPAQLRTSVGMYHEATCASVDRSRMTRMKRGAAVEMGLIPAPDCHPDARVRYLGTTWWPTSFAEVPTEPESMQVRGYTRHDGTEVGAYTRRRPR